MSLFGGNAFLTQGDNTAEQVGFSWMHTRNERLSLGAEAAFVWSVDTDPSLLVNAPAEWRERYHGVASLVVAYEPLRLGRRREHVLGVRVGPALRYRSDDGFLAQSGFLLDQEDALNTWLDLTLDQTPGGQARILEVQGAFGEDDYYLGVVTQQTQDLEAGGLVGLSYRIDLGAIQVGVLADGHFYQEAGPTNAWRPGLSSLRTAVGYRF